MKKIFSLFTSSNHSILLLFTLVIFFEKWSLLCRPHLTTKATHAKSNGDLHIAKSYLFSCPLILELLTTIDMGHHYFPFFIMVSQPDFNIVHTPSIERQGLCPQPLKLIGLVSASFNGAQHVKLCDFRGQFFPDSLGTLALGESSHNLQSSTALRSPCWRGPMQALQSIA